MGDRLFGEEFWPPKYHCHIHRSPQTQPYPATWLRMHPPPPPSLNLVGSRHRPRALASAAAALQHHQAARRVPRLLPLQRPPITDVAGRGDQPAAEAITVLAVDNDATGAISSLPSDVQRKCSNQWISTRRLSDSNLGFSGIYSYTVKRIVSI
jgi:hypothetical protein